MSLGLKVTVTKPCPQCGAMGKLDLLEDGPRNINPLGTLAQRLAGRSMLELLTQEIQLDGFPFLCPKGHTYEMSDESVVAAPVEAKAAREWRDIDTTGVCRHCGLRHKAEICG